MSDQIISRIDDMSARIDDLEHNINDLMSQAGDSFIEFFPNMFFLQSPLWFTFWFALIFKELWLVMSFFD